MPGARRSETTPAPLRHMYGRGITLRVGRVNVRAEMPDCVGHVAAGHFHPEHVVTRKVRFEDVHEAIGDPKIRVAFVRDGIERGKTVGLPRWRDRAKGSW
jgi:threonine dehydrogenase-like Zn-dependent dehydrogenase